MNGVSRSIRLAGWMALLLTPLVGCQSNSNVRLPSLAYGDPRGEIRSYSQHDPYPESNVGPLVERPRAAMTQRSEPRRTMERAVQPMAGDQPESAARYPNSVQP